MELTEKGVIKWIKEHWKNHKVDGIEITIRGRGTRERLELDKRYMEEK